MIAIETASRAKHTKKKEMDYYIGHTHIQIRTDYCVKTREEVQTILDRIAARALPILSAAEMEKTEGN